MLSKIVKIIASRSNTYWKGGYNLLELRIPPLTKDSFFLNSEELETELNLFGEMLKSD